jgi:hypothetical protein
MSRRPLMTTSPTGENTAASTAGEIQVAQQLQAAEARLVDRYRDVSGISEDRVRNSYVRAVERFSQARVRNFLPILVERAVQRELEHAT